MIYTVTTNPNIDYYMNLSAPMAVGGINRSVHELLAPGGKGINVSLMLQTLGKPSCVLGYLAGPTGRLLEALMKDTGCDCHWFWLQSGQTRINTKINTSPETAFNAAGPALDEAAVAALCAFLRTLQPDDQLVISGNLQKSPAGAFSALLAAAQDAGVSAIVDTSGPALREALAFRPLLIKPNSDELGELFGQSAGTSDAIRQPFLLFPIISGLSFLAANNLPGQSRNITPKAYDPLILSIALVSASRGVPVFL